MKNIKEITINTGESISYDDEILKERIEYAKKIREQVQAGKISPQEATKLLNEFGKKNKHWI
jgi:hypothetical protein